MADRLYYADSFLKTFEARVADIRLLARNDGETLWQVAFDRTVFYPTSGGQPFDTGKLVATSRSGATLEVPVINVEEDEAGEIWHTTTKPLAAATEVTGEIDWPRRLDHMQQHSAQHLLSAVCARELEAHTVSFHLGAETSTIDIRLGLKDSETTGSGSLFPPELELEGVERVVNELIAEDRPMCVRNVERAEAEEMLTAGRLRKLPERLGAMRLIDIADYDLNACGGTHVRSTGQIGGLLLRSVENFKQGLRVEFVAGLRAVATARTDFELLTRASGLLSIGRTSVPDAIARVLAENKAAAKERHKLRTELAQYHAVRLVVEDNIEDNLRVVQRQLAEYDADYAKLLASSSVAAVPQTLALIASTREEPASLIMARSGDLDVNCGALLKQAVADLGLRGGGSASLAQAQVPAADVQALCLRLQSEVRALLREAAIK
ncbi:MAG TPA: DHHA1 domain-containing protein [Acidisarcina sp.]